MQAHSGSGALHEDHPHVEERVRCAGEGEGGCPRRHWELWRPPAILAEAVALTDPEPRSHRRRVAGPQTQTALEERLLSGGGAGGRKLIRPSASFPATLGVPLSSRTMHSSRFSLFLTGGQVLSHVRADGMSEPMELSSQMESAVAELPKPRVLLVDNDGTSRASSATALRSAGLEVIEARDAEEGFAMARSEQPNLIVCDLKPERPS